MSAFIKFDIRDELRLNLYEGLNLMNHKNLLIFKCLLAENFKFIF
ncbi:hypothetical protein CCS77_1182 [Campylobacter concisus]|uniref:Uncharacterized protein n=1 Tax=Campylobacter concisus TaxID=199 RepID=A0A2R4P0P6_9BACT|nr:hypothetical protein CCS77_1182 [Campylobacter concisus]ERJ28374.1 hypothetical protein ATCC51561_579 [Campylobacter concisus ATCC 51561]